MFGLFQRPRPYRTPTLELQNLDQTGLEMEWLYTKEELISTDFEKWNARYTDLSIRGSELLPRVLAHYGRVFDPDGIKISKYMTYSPICRGVWGERSANNGVLLLLWPRRGRRA